MNPHERFIVHKDLNLARLPIPPLPHLELLEKNIALFSKRSRGGTTHSHIFLNERSECVPPALAVRGSNGKARYAVVKPGEGIRRCPPTGRRIRRGTGE